MNLVRVIPPDEIQDLVDRNKEAYKLLEDVSDKLDKYIYTSSKLARKKEEVEKKLRQASL